VETLVEQPALMSYHELGEEELAAIGAAYGLIRLAAGVEETADVVAPVRRALGERG
jgi:cystathionine gamma-synthase